MNVAFSVLLCFSHTIVKVFCLPQEVCSEQFKWQDCGMYPKAVVYYYKSGSRCEVGMWRGCLPNNNMFIDEYECVQTCIFSLRARAEDFHKHQAGNFIEYEDLGEPDGGDGTEGSEATESKKIETTENENAAEKQDTSTNELENTTLNPNEISQVNTATPETDEISQVNTATPETGVTSNNINTQTGTNENSTPDTVTNSATETEELTTKSEKEPGDPADSATTVTDKNDVIEAENK